MRLIDADALFQYNGHSLSDAVKYGNKDAEQQEWSYSTMMMYEIADEIDDAPTIDAVPVVHGRWEIVRRMADGAICECSVCGRQERFDSFHRHDNCPYCHCGAKMDFDNKNQEEKL